MNETIKLVRLSRKEHLNRLQNEIDSTPKWKIFKRASLIRIYNVLATNNK